MRVHVKHADGEQWGGLRGRNEWHVWVSLDEIDTNELEDAEMSFIIASRPTREQALLYAWDVFGKAAMICEQLRDSPLTSSLAT